MAVGEFSLNVDKFVAETKGRLEEFCVEFVQDLNEQIVRNTPVDLGNLRAHWWSALNTRPPSPGGAADPSGASTIARLNLVGAALKPGDTYFMINGAAYAMRLEFGFVGKDSLGRNYNQAPRVFVRSVLGRAGSIAAATAKRVGAR